MKRIFQLNFESIILILLITVSFVMMLYSSVGDSLVFDELAHIPAGYSYVKYLDNRLNVEHPPLIKALSGIPLIFLNLNFPLSSSGWDNSDEWEVGDQFIFNSNNDADKIVFWARIAPIILTLLLIFFTYTCAKDLVGKRWALLPAFFTAFSPNILAHGHYVATDIGVSFLMFVAIYYFSKYISNPSSSRLLIASGLTFGLAQLAKFSALILVPIFIVLAVVDALINKQWLNSFKKTLLVFLIGYLLVYATYFLISLNYPPRKQFKNTELILGFSDPQRARTTFESCSKENIGLQLRARCFLKENFLRISSNKAIRPLNQYLTGAWVVYKQSISAHHPTFLNGSICDCGRWYYFPELIGLKEPLPGLIFILISLIYTVYMFIRKKFKNGFRRFSNYIVEHFTEFSFLFFIIVYGSYSMRSNLNIGVRHILPIMVPAYVLATVVVKEIKISSMYRNVLIAILIFWYAIETFMAAPYFISYFNELGGGIWNGYNYAVDSNYDWGQDLKRLAKWVDVNHIQRINVDYFGTANLNYYLKGKVSQRRKDANWFAVSVHLLKMHPDRYLWLKTIKEIDHPDYKAGTSIFIYRL